MSADLHRLIYCSRAYAETRDLHAHVESILQVSIRNNTAADVTGLLLVHEAWFVQVLEGTEGAVMRTFGRIACDRRHQGAQVLSGGAIDERAFARWSMCARRLDSQTRSRLVRRRLPFNPTRLAGDAALELLLASASEPDLAVA